MEVLRLFIAISDESNILCIQFFCDYRRFHIEANKVIEPA